MRKSRFVVKEANIQVSGQLLTSTVFETLASMDIAIPSWASMIFFFVRTEKKILDASFFEDSKDFFIWYSRVLIRRAYDLKVISLSKEEGEWRFFVPPTLIGLNLRTTIRQDLDEGL